MAQPFWETNLALGNKNFYSLTFGPVSRLLGIYPKEIIRKTRTYLQGYLNLSWKKKNGINQSEMAEPITTNPQSAI